MAGTTYSLKTRLLYFTGILTLLAAFVLVLQYNNYFYSVKFQEYQKATNHIVYLSGKTEVLTNRFIKNDVVVDKFYSEGRSESIDSINTILGELVLLLDSIQNDPFLKVGKDINTKINGLIGECKNFKNDIENLRTVYLDRGFLTTGISGEWTRFATYLQELADSYGNITVIKATSEINQKLSAYQFQKDPSILNELLSLTNSLKTQISTKNDRFVKGLASDEQLKFVKELDNFSALTNQIQKSDLLNGITGNGGLMGKVNVSSSVIISLAEDVKSSVNQNIIQKIETGFYVKFAIIILLFGLFYLFSRSIFVEISSAIYEIKRFANELVEGKLPESLRVFKLREISNISGLFNRFIESLRDKIKFASTLGSGESEHALIPLSSEDHLSNALLDMEKSLLKAEEEDKKYKIEEQKRAWANEGLARFSEILRMQTDNLSTLSDAIIIELVKSLRANQGTLFLYNDDNEYDIHLELITAFAYDRKKYTHKRIEIGEGLVGTCAIEKLPIYLTEIPEDYIEITSGLGNSSPRCLLIVPLKTEEKIFGVLEIASFQSLESHEIEFVEKLAQSIASTFATVKINIHTAKLLEQSKRQAEEMAQQEEEMRQNFEELQATQEESARREAEITSLIQAVDASSLVIHTDMEGRIIEVNKKFSAAIGLNRDELLGRLLKQVFTFNSVNDEFYNFIRELKQGNQVSRSEQIIHDDGHSMFFEVHYSPILDHDGRPYKILCIAGNLTQSHALESAISSKNNEIENLQFAYNQFDNVINESFIRCNLALDTTIMDVNEFYTEITGYSREESINTSYRKFLKTDELKQFELIWLELQKNKSYKGVIKRTTPTGDEHWLMASFTPFRGKDQKLTHIQMFAQDITEKKLKYQVLEEANKEIERLKGLQNQ